MDFFFHEPKNLCSWKKKSLFHEQISKKKQKFSKKSENPGIFVPEIWGSGLKTVPTIRINSKNSVTTKSFLY